jgi:hypothetical protein
MFSCLGSLGESDFCVLVAEIFFATDARIKPSRGSESVASRCLECLGSLGCLECLVV